MKGYVLSIKRNNSGIYGFIRPLETPSNAGREYNYYYNGTGIVKGNHLNIGALVNFDAYSLSNRRVAVHVELASACPQARAKPLQTLNQEKAESVLSALLSDLDAQGFFRSEQFIRLLQSHGIENFHDYANSIEDFVNLYFHGAVKTQKNVWLNGKAYPLVIVRVSNQSGEELNPPENPSVHIRAIQNLSQETLSAVKLEIAQFLSERGYILASYIPTLLNKNGIDDYHCYAVSMKEFVAKYLGNELVWKGSMLLHGIRYPDVLLPKDYMSNPAFKDALTREAPQNSEKQIAKRNALLESMRQTYQRCESKEDYAAFLRSDIVSSSELFDLGVEGIQIALTALAGYLGEDTSRVELNRLHEQIILAKFPHDIYPLRVDKDLMELGRNSALFAMSLPDFEMSFATLCNGKQAPNSAWRSLSERFWAIKSNLAFEFTALWTITRPADEQKIKCVQYYIDEESKSRNLSRLSEMLQIYLDFNGQDDKSLPLALVHKIMGRCLDFEDIQTLLECIPFFDETDIPEIREVESVLRNEQSVEYETLLSWYRSKIRPSVAGKLINYCWKTVNQSNGFPEAIFKALSIILLEYPIEYFESIIYNDSYEEFGRKEKRKILCGQFQMICQYAKSCHIVYLLADYIFGNFLSGQRVEQEEKTENDRIMSELSAWMLKIVKSHLSADISTTQEIALFKNNSLLREELEAYYCKTFIDAPLELCESEDIRIRLLDSFHEASVSFIKQWISVHYDDASDLSFSHLISAGKYSEAILYIRNQETYSSESRDKSIRAALRENFRSMQFDESAFRIYDSAISFQEAEKILMEDFDFNDAASMMALIASYIHEGEWLKASYLYAPASVFHSENYRKFFMDAKRFLNGKIYYAYANDHIGVLRNAIIACDVAEFDAFLAWARQIRLPNQSINYQVTSRPLNIYIKNFLDDKDYEFCWNQLLRGVILSESKERLDNLRYSVVLSYIVRYGFAQYDETLRTAINPQKKAYFDSFSALWRGLLGGSYSANFLPLHQNLAKELPLTYWNQFYDVAVCKNHLFANDYAFDYHHLSNSHFSYQSFYDSMLDCYVETRESVYLKIAVSILVESAQPIAPSFEKYISFLSVSQNKDFLLRALISMASNRRYREELGILLHSDSWKGTESEKKLIQALSNLFVDNYDELPLSCIEAFSEDQLASLKADFLKSFSAYPALSLVDTVEKSLEDAFYQYQLAELVFRIQYVQSQYRALKRMLASPAICDGWQTDLRLQGYLHFMSVCYRMQLSQRQRTVNEITYVKNRYLRLLAIHFLLGGLPENPAEFDDEELIALMQGNSHFADAYPEYQKLRDLFFRLTRSGTPSRLTAVFLLGFVSNQWGAFIDSADEYSEETLKLLHTIETLSNYRELNMQLLERFLPDDAEETTPDEASFSFIRFCSPQVYDILRELFALRRSDTKQFKTVKGWVYSICRLDNQNSAKASYKSFFQLIKNHSFEDLAPYENLLMNAFVSTSYSSTLIFLLSEDVRAGNVSLNFLIRWQSIMRAINSIHIFHYLMALCYAMNHRRTEALGEYAQITQSLPQEWLTEQRNLNNYLNGGAKKFLPSQNQFLATLSVEKEAGEISFLHAYCSSANTQVEEALTAYRKALETENPEEKLSEFRKLFAFIRKPIDLFDLYKLDENRKQRRNRRRYSYNELVIQFGSLLILYGKELSHDQKLPILLTLFNVYELLNSNNKEDNGTRNALVDAEMAVLEKQGLSFDAWIQETDSILKILRHPLIESPATAEERLETALIQCAEIASSETEMERYAKLEKWRRSWNFTSQASNWENAVVKAVESELNRLRNGVNLRLTVVDNVIEDKQIFYQVENSSEMNKTVRLDNARKDSASVYLQVLIGTNGEKTEPYEEIGFDNQMELRPGDICGQAYPIHESILSRLAAGDTVEIILNLSSNGRVICNNRQELHQFVWNPAPGTLTKEMLSSGAKYTIDSPAFHALNRGFGRKSEQERIREFLREHLVVLYGPSRAGKSSLLNYITNQYLPDYAKEFPQKAVLCVTIGDNIADYEWSIVSKREPVDFSDSNQILSYLFLSPLEVAFRQKYAVTRKERCRIVNGEFPERVREDVLTILDAETDVHSKVLAVSRVLEENACEIWLLYDEFQYVVQHWLGSADEFATFCHDLKYKQNGFRLVLCGSDEMVRIFECENNPMWSRFTISVGDNRVPVNQMNPDDFYDMMRDSNVWRTQVFAPHSLELLYAYTGGNAVCGKIFGTQILQMIRKGYFANRRHIYSADITHIAFQLRKEDVGLMKQQLLTHNDKNLEHERKYLLFIANELRADINIADVSLEKIRKFFISSPLMEIDMAMKMLIARGILRKSPNRQAYAFTSMFYYDFFRDEATDSVMRTITEEATAKTEESAMGDITQSEMSKKNRREYIQLFMMTPFNDSYESVEKAVRMVFECPPFCFEVLLARNSFKEDALMKNLRTHIADADGFIAEISEHNPNVMMEVGAVLITGDSRPVFAIKSKESSKKTPVDFGDKLIFHYTDRNSDPEDIAEEIKRDMIEDRRLTNGNIAKLLEKRRKRFLSRTILENLETPLKSEQISKIMGRFKTVEDFLEADGASLATLSLRPGLTDWLREDIVKLMEENEILMD